MQRIAVQQEERKYLFLDKYFTTEIPKEPYLGNGMIGLQVEGLPA